MHVLTLTTEVVQKLHKYGFVLVVTEICCHKLSFSVAFKLHTLYFASLALLPSAMACTEVPLFLPIDEDLDLGTVVVVIFMSGDKAKGRIVEKHVDGRFFTVEIDLDSERSKRRQGKAPFADAHQLE